MFLAQNRNLSDMLIQLFSEVMTLEQQQDTARVVQFLCITVACQLVCGEYCHLQHYIRYAMDEKIAKHNAKERKAYRRERWKVTLPHYMNAIHEVIFAHRRDSDEVMTQQDRATYQFEFGYLLYSDYLLFFFPVPAAALKMTVPALSMMTANKKRRKKKENVLDKEIVQRIDVQRINVQRIDVQRIEQLENANKQCLERLRDIQSECLLVMDEMEANTKEIIRIVNSR